MRRVAIVGAGPAGMYAAEALSKSGRVDIDILDRLPVPCGLVRYPRRDPGPARSFLPGQRRGWTGCLR